MPTQDDLCSGFAVSGGNLTDCRVVEHTGNVLPQRSPCFHLNALAERIAHDIMLGHVRLDLDLIDYGAYACIFQQLVEMVRVEVAHADAADFPLVHVFLQYLPSPLDMSLHGPVDEYKVDVVRPEVGKTFVERLAHGAASHFRGVHFRGDEQLTAVYSAPAYAFTHLFFVSVTLCRVDQAESDLDCMAYSFCGIVLDQERADSQLRHFHAVVQFYSWYFIHFLCVCLNCHPPYKGNGKDCF